ncbi:MAG: amino acid ABC transporter permease [Actinomycetota bacterium]
MIPDLRRSREERRSKILGSFKAEGVRGVLIAILSTLVFLGVLIAIVINSPNWLLIKQQFFNSREFSNTFPYVLHGFFHNIEVFLMLEPLILVFALLLAVMRSLRGPIFFPIRALAIVYIDFFRGIPTILLVYLFGFGVPALQIPGLPHAGAFWGGVGLLLSYSAYVAEVYRAGIESVHASQTAAARSLGLTRAATLRFVIVPQAVRRVVPPLMNDFISLQKDTALLSIVGGQFGEAFNHGQISQQSDFNFTSLLGVALCFLVITVPMTRFTDHVLERQRRRRMAGAAL